MAIILFLIILVILILVHELGHFVVAKKAGIRVDEFGIGFPPKAMTLWKWGETEYTLNWLPLGGFVKIFGENPDEKSLRGPDRDRSFIHKPKVVQAAVLVAGVVFNILFAWVLFSVVFMLGMPSALLEEEAGEAHNVRLIISEVLPNSPAEIAGLMPGDEVVALTALEESAQDLLPSIVSDYIVTQEDKEIAIFVKRDEEVIEILVIPKYGVIEEEQSRPAIGIAMGLIGRISFSPPAALWEGAKFTVEITKLIAVSIAAFLGSVLTLNADLSSIAGPVGIVSLVGDASALGFVFILNFTAFISINLAIINLLPFPALDGGRLLFLFIEVVKGSPIKPNIANTVNTIGFALLILLMLVVTYNDISRIVG